LLRGNFLENSAALRIFSDEVPECSRRVRESKQEEDIDFLELSKILSPIYWNHCTTETSSMLPVTKKSGTSKIDTEDGLIDRKSSDVDPPTF
jgi:hypothetical protein